jgi:hypothetical protein
MTVPGLENPTSDGVVRPSLALLDPMVGEVAAHVQGESLKAVASLSDVAFSTPRSPGGEV